MEPNLGVVKTDYGDSFVLADIPGIIEGASSGVGLGLQFLRHIERTRLLLHVIDISGSENRNPVDDFYKVQEELKKYSAKLATRKQIIVANKSDIAQDEKLYSNLEKVAKKENMEIYRVTAATGNGLKELMIHVAEVLKTLPKEEIISDKERVVYTLKEEKAPYDIKKENGEYIVTGPAVERLMNNVNIEDNESLAYFSRMIDKLGINQKLKEMGAKEGDTIRLADWEFEWYE